MFNYNGTSYEFVVLGLFSSDKRWIHPERCEDTYEIIYVTKGEVHLLEGKTSYDLKVGDLVILRPHILHVGSRESNGETSFYWLHFHSEKDVFPQLVEGYDGLPLFKELLHRSRNENGGDENLVNAIFLHLIYDIMCKDAQLSSTSLAEEIREWVRINASASLTVAAVAEHFGYNSEYTSRLVGKSFGMTLKKLIDRYIISRSNDLLCNSHFFVKEISETVGFKEPSAFINFYKYHTKMTPTAFRNLYSKTHLNNR